MATELGRGRSGGAVPAAPHDDPQCGDGVSASAALAQAGGPSLEISVSGLIDAAMVFRPLMPNTSHRLRRSW